MSVTYLKPKLFLALFMGLFVGLYVISPVLASPPGMEAGDIGPEETWGESTRVVQAGRFFIAGQPDEAALERAHENGVTMIINLRGASESEWDEAGVAEALGLEFHRVPVNGAAPRLSSESFERISGIVESNPDSKIFVHCSSGNRASAWFATYLAQYLGVGEEDAIALANRTGLNRQALEDKVRAYLGQ